MCYMQIAQHLLKGGLQVPCSFTDALSFALVRSTIIRPVKSINSFTLCKVKSYLHMLAEKILEDTKALIASGVSASKHRGGGVGEVSIQTPTVCDLCHDGNLKQRNLKYQNLYH